ncbi:hypothetical protein SDC9_206226 [bioreactor metagenome]|uniref:Uncharacterized protein n=1 Tax=bioreactor metagenome TaxID=1076179 RepID=A0A645J4G0_9ZZZZ
MKYLVRSKNVPILEVKYPESYEEAQDFVNKIAEFLKTLPKEESEEDEKAKEEKQVEQEDKT